MPNKTAQQWIDQLELQPHPEGGFYKRIYASSEHGHYNQATRPICTSIHYLLKGQNYSAWHRIKSDEQWFFHSGCALSIWEIDQQGQLHQHILGMQHALSIVIKAGHWFCATPTETYSRDFSLVSCTVSPGFLFEEFEMANAQQLSNAFPQYKDLIAQYCRQ